MKNKKTSCRSIENRVNNYILRYCKGKDIYNFTTNDYLNWQIKIDNMNFKYSYKKNLHVCFVTFLNYCKKFYNLKENVASLVGNFRNDEIETCGNVWTIEDFNKFIKVVDNKVYNVLFKFMFFTGCRLGETLALKFSDIENNIVFIHNNATRFFENEERIFTSPKTKKSIRKISIDNKLKNEIFELQEYYNTLYKNFNNDLYVFGGKNIIAPTTLTRKKNYYCDVARVKRIKLHEFRHSHACLLFQHNVPIDEISHRLGHATLSMTMDVYLKYIPRNEKRVLETLNSLRLN